jgi:pyrroline-5-carboxylate reductase
VDVKPRLGVIGGGRLAEGIAKTWLARTGQAPLIWSRSGPRDSRISEATWITRWTGTLEAESVAIAIPGRALLDLAEGNEQARQFTGNIFSAAASLSHASLQQVFPQATIVCIAPFLIDGVNSIPLIALRPANLSNSEWTNAKAALDDFGNCDVVEDEAVFARMYLLGAAWPAVVLAAVRAAADAGVQGLPDEAAMKLGKQIFLRGIHSLLNAETSSEIATRSEIATPGGITERGLKSLGEVTLLFDSVFQQMQARAEELRA